MPLTEEQKKVRQKHFPGRRGFLPPDQMELFRQYCQEAGCPLEEGVFKRPRNSPAVKEEAPDWVPGMTVMPRQRKAKRKTDSYYGSLDSSEVGEGASYGHAAAAAAAAAAAGELPHGQDRLLVAARMVANGGQHRQVGLRLGEADSGSSGEDLSHKHPRLGNLPHAAHSQLNLQQQQQQRQHVDDHDRGVLDPAAAAAVGAAHGDAVGGLGSPQRSGQLPGGAAAAAADADADAAADADADADADAAGVDTVHPAARPPMGPHSDRRAGSFDDAEDDQEQQQEEAAGAGLDEGPTDDVIKGLIDLRAAHAGHPAASAPTAAAAAAGSGDLDFQASLDEFEQQQQQHDEQHHQQQQQYAPVLTVSTGRGRGGRPRGRPPSRGRGRGRGRVKRDSEPIAVGSPLHPVAPLQYHSSAPVYHHGSGGGMAAAAAAAAAHHHYPSAFGSLGGGGGGGQGQSTLARLTHAAAMAEGMGTRGDRSRPDDYYQVYTEYFAAQEAYHRLMSSLAANPMLHLVPEPEVPESLYGPAYAGRVQDSANMLAAAAAIDLLSPGALSASRRKRQHSGTGHKPAAAGAAAGGAGGAADHMDLDQQDHRQSAEGDLGPAAGAAAGALSKQHDDAILAAANEAAAILAAKEAAAAGEHGGDVEGAAGAAGGVLEPHGQEDDTLVDDS